MENRKLLIFTKNPIAGTVKTRISRVKGDDVALEVYQKLLQYTCQISMKVKAERTVFFNDHIESNGIWNENHFRKQMQVAGNLGLKMSAAFKNAFLSGCNKAVIIGSDCAEISENDIEQAFQLLDQSDFVIGPAVDGGYYLLGMKKFHKFIFENMPWSQEKLHAATVACISENGFDYRSLDTKSDIDYWEDWVKLGW